VAPTPASARSEPARALRARVAALSPSRLRAYRALRVARGILRVFPRYAWLAARARGVAGWRRPASRERWERVHRLAAEELRDLALALGGGFTKAAQIGGARADVLPAAFVDVLGRFHDAVPPRPFAELAPAVERGLGRPPAEVFAEIEAEALAAASLAQVHRARLRDGSRVVLKIQYPEVRRLIPLDLGMLRLVARLAQLLQRRIDLRSVVDEVARFVELELDFVREVGATERLAKMLADRPDVRVPRVHRALCGGDLIVLEYLEGIQVTHTRALETAGHSLAAVARRIGALYGAMIFEHGFFHGDPHPGNLLVLPDGRIGLLDFGLCKELPPGFARDVAQMMVCAMIGDAQGATDAARALGFETSELRAEDLRSLMLMVLGDSDTERDLLDILGTSRIRRIPEDVALVLRTLVLLNGLSHRLAPRRRLVQGELVRHLAIGAARA